MGIFRATQRLSSRTFLAIALYLGAAGVAAAADFYVDQAHPGAADDNPGTEQQPWKSMYAINAAKLQPGDTVYVKAGTYDVSKGGSWQAPAIRPAASGTSDRPITLKSLPQHAAVLDAKGGKGAIGTTGKHHIVIDGFVVRNADTSAVLVFGGSVSSRVQGVVVQNNIIENVRNPAEPAGNTQGIMATYVSGLVIRNNIIRDVHNGSDNHNANGVKMFHTDHVVFEHNEVSDMPVGFYDKEGGQNTVVRYNYFHDLSRNAVQFATQNGTPSGNHEVYQNIVWRAGTGYGVINTSSGDVISNVKVYNNLFAEYSNSGVKPQYDPGDGETRLWNNIFWTGNTTEYGELAAYADPAATVAQMDFNLYGREPQFYVGIYKTNRVLRSLAEWQSYANHDIHSAIGDPGFIDAAGGNFRLRPESVARDAGRVGGALNGEPVNLGPYITGDETIGLLSEDAPQVAPPKAPTILEVRVN